MSTTRQNAQHDKSTSKLDFTGLYEASTEMKNTPKLHRFCTIFQNSDNFRHVLRPLKSHKRPLYKGLSHITANIITDFHGVILVQFWHNFGTTLMQFHNIFVLFPFSHFLVFSLYYYCISRDLIISSSFIPDLNVSSSSFGSPDFRSPVPVE